jgi:hypothetical protein
MVNLGESRDSQEEDASHIRSLVGTAALRMPPLVT